MSQGLKETAARTDGAVGNARTELVAAVRAAAANGMTQAEIAREIGRSQPEVSRLLRFHGRTALARRLRQNAAGIRRLVKQAGGANVRVFGSVATGSDRADSDVDLLFTMRTPLSLIELGVLERGIEELVGAPVDLVAEATLRPELRERVEAEAVVL